MTRRNRYSTEFKREAIRRCNEPGVTAVLVVEELGIYIRSPQRVSRVCIHDKDTRK